MALSNRDFLVDGVVCIDCCNRGMFVPHTNESIFEIVDSLALIENPTELKSREQECGFNFNPHGLLMDFDLRDRGLVCPADQYLRDPMHTLVSHGQANTHTAMLMHTLKKFKIKPEVVSEYAQSFTLPFKYGKVSVEWLHRNRLSQKDKSHFSSYAATMLSLVPLVFAFLMDNVHSSEHGAPLQDHIRCYGLLSSILGLLQRVDTAVTNVDHLIYLIDEYGALFIRLYDRAKPKFHHMFHIHESIMRFKKMLSCFVTERKHRATKKAALHVFRYLEQTVLKDLVNRMCESYTSCLSLFQPTFLVSPKIANGHGSELRKSDKAVLSCGMLRKGDIVFAKEISATVGRVLRFWEYNDQSIVVCLASYTAIRGDDNRFWSRASPSSVFVRAASIVDAVAWRIHDAHADVIRIIPPFCV